MLRKISKSIRRDSGLAQIPLILGLLLMAIAIPIATRLAQQNQDLRNRAATHTRYACRSGMCVVDAGGPYTVSDCNNECGNPIPTRTPTPIASGLPGGSDCLLDSQCTSGECTFGKCEPLSVYHICADDDQCGDGNCCVTSPLLVKTCWPCPVVSTPTPATRYACRGAGCVVDAGGPYTVSDCNNECVVIPTRTPTPVLSTCRWDVWHCTGDCSTGDCKFDIATGGCHCVSAPTLIPTSSVSSDCNPFQDTYRCDGNNLQQCIDNAGIGIWTHIDNCCSPWFSGCGCDSTSKKCKVAPTSVPVVVLPTIIPGGNCTVNLLNQCIDDGSCNTRGGRCSYLGTECGCHTLVPITPTSTRIPTLTPTSVTRYTCNPATGICSPTTGSGYNTLALCTSNCVRATSTPRSRYKCNITGSCTQD
ncbi:hypothetical protein KKA02_04260, partial [Patescibacteria group bacterium]|nr:hypothetical protein [Patescibacteria group bacterium]